jgi:hypothetical protein
MGRRPVGSQASRSLRVCISRAAGCGLGGAPWQGVLRLKGTTTSLSGSLLNERTEARYRESFCSPSVRERAAAHRTGVDRYGRRWTEQDGHKDRALSMLYTGDLQGFLSLCASKFASTRESLRALPALLLSTAERTGLLHLRATVLYLVRLTSERKPPGPSLTLLHLAARSRRRPPSPCPPSRGPPVAMRRA